MADETNSLAQVTLVLGGAASGKSRYAQRLTEGHAGPLLYVATAEAGDGEMAERIARHRQERGDRWLTLEEPMALAAALPAAAEGKAAVLIDCMTLWLTNLLLANEDSPEQVWPPIEAFIDALDTIACPVYLVSNELGQGLVPEQKLGRVFRDLAGALNQRLAAMAGTVWLVVAGLPVRLK